MTLSELRELQTIIIFTKSIAVSQRLFMKLVESEKVIKREITLKTMDPRTGKEL